VSGTWSDEELARAAWSRLAEPGDVVAGAVLASMGAAAALEWLTGVADHPGSPFALTSEAPGDIRRLDLAVQRWVPRLPTLRPERDLEHITGMGGRLVVPGSEEWPQSLNDLGAAGPTCLWVRGCELSDSLERAVAVVGARACSAYGEHVTAEICAGLADRGWTVVSGGAFGVDAAAHRGALAAGGGTVAFLAGGAERPYPAGNARLLRAIVDSGGSVVSEVPPGSVPTKVRFLQRNRLIAAAGAATVVVEAAWRSGALNTAGHAAALLRPVGAVPGPVTSVTSAGCHQLLRDGVAVCVTDAQEVVELVGPVRGDPAAPDRRVEREGDDLSPEARRAVDALPLRRGATVEAIMREAGLSLAETRSALGSLELAGLARQDEGSWRRAPRRGAGGAG
jgi:DNA processing protein